MPAGKSDHEIIIHSTDIAEMNFVTNVVWRSAVQSPEADRRRPVRSAAAEAVAACSVISNSANLPTQAERLILSIFGDHFGYWGWDVAAGYLIYSPQVQKLINLTGSETCLADYMSRIHPEDADRVWAATEAHIVTNVVFNEEYRLRVDQDAYLWVRVRCQSIRDENGKAIFMAGTLEDATASRLMSEMLTAHRDELEARVRERTAELATINAALEAEVGERKAAEQALEMSRSLYHSLVENVPYTIFRKDLEGRYTYGNRRYCELHAIDLPNLIGKTDLDLYPAELALKYRGDDIRTIEHREVLDTEEEHEPPGEKKQRQIVHTIKYPIIDAEGRVVGVQGMFADVTDRRKSAQMLTYQATHDSLTDLPNRCLFQEELEKAIREADEQFNPFAVLLIDLDRFKDINDSLGHHYGDAVLQELGPRLRNAVRPGDTVARLGGDEFGIVLLNADLDAARHVVQRLLAELSIPISIDGHTLDVGASIGIALHPDHGRDQSTLVRRADIAMYTAKKSRCGYAISTAETSAFTPQRLELIARLRQAAGLDQLRLQFQPKVSLLTGRTVGAESLLRWQHPTQGLLPPNEFIPIAEQIGLIGSLDRWAIAASLSQCRTWRDGGVMCSTAVNLSAANLHDALIAQEIVQMVRQAGVPPSALIVEVTECAIMTEPQVAREILFTLRDEGIAIAIDDFGIGHSSLAYLRELPVDHLKIDQSFIRGMESCDKNFSIVRAVIELGHKLGLGVTAEGVETRVCMDMLKSLGCDEVQGYFLSAPLTPCEFDQWLRRAPEDRPL